MDVWAALDKMARACHGSRAVVSIGRAGYWITPGIVRQHPTCPRIQARLTMSTVSRTANDEEASCRSQRRTYELCSTRAESSVGGR